MRLETYYVKNRLYSNGNDGYRNSKPKNGLIGENRVIPVWLFTV